MRRALAVILSFLIPAAAMAQTDPISGTYGFFLNLFNPFNDPNAGETVFRIVNVPMGGYSEGMVSALTAYPVEASAFTVNAAVSSLLEENSLAIYHNNWISTAKVESAIYSLRLGQLGLGVAGKWAYIPDFKEFDDFSAALAKGSFSESMVLANVSYNFFSGYYFDGVSLGANLKAAYRAVPDYTDETGIVVAGSGAGQSALGLMADIGALTRFNLLKFYPSRSKNAALGLTVRNLGAPVLGEAMPTAVALGAAYSPIRPLMVTVDLTKPLNLMAIGYSGGMEYAIAVNAAILEFFTVYGGFQLKNNPRLSAGASVALADVTVVVNYTLDLATTFSDMNRFSIEVKLNLGDGGRYALRLKVEEFYLSGVEEYANGNLESAIALWTEALKLDSGFDPARESRSTARRALELRKALDDIQRLEG
jgi:hypothetical protein